MITISALGLFWLILGGFVAALSILLVINNSNKHNHHVLIYSRTSTTPTTPIICAKVSKKYLTITD